MIATFILIFNLVEETHLSLHYSYMAQNFLLVFINESIFLLTLINFFI